MSSNKLVILKKHKNGNDAEYDWFKNLSLKDFGISNSNHNKRIHSLTMINNNDKIIKSYSDSVIAKKRNSKVKITWKKINKALEKIDTLNNLQKISKSKLEINIDDHKEFINIIKDYLDPNNKKDFIYIKFMKK
jgi:hypothetical protein